MTLQRFNTWILLFSSLLLSTVSCSDILNEENVSGITQSHYDTKSGFEDGVNAAYNTARSFYGTELGGSLTVFGTDAWTNGADGGNKYVNQYTPRLNAQATVSSILWPTFYQGINTINTVLAKADNLNLEPALKQQRVGELKFLRSLYYFNLLRTYGALPLHLEPINSPSSQETRAPVEQVYDAVISDLDSAVAALPRQVEDQGRATKGAAQQLLAMVHLRRGYISSNESDFKQASDLAESIINSGNYELLPNYEDIFDLENQTNPEIIWAIQYSEDPLSDGNGVDGLKSGNSSHLYFGMKYDELPGMQRTVQYWRPYTRFKPTKFLLNLWDYEKDTRYNASFITTWYANNPDNIPTNDAGNPKFAIGDTAVWMPPPSDTKDYSNKPYMVISPEQYYQSERFYPSLGKFLDNRRPNKNYTAGSRDFFVYRLGMTYLVAAEALFQQGQKAEAASYMNTLRERAAVAGRKDEMNITASELTQDFILNEWARETAGEYRRWFDLTRMQQLVSRVTKYNPEGGMNIDDHFILRPIPQSQMDAVTSPDFTQNPGY